MRRPNIRLTNDGCGRETITITQSTYDADIEGDWVETGSISTIYPAIVSRYVAQPYNAVERLESQGNYTVTIYTDDPPKTAINQKIVWTKLGIKRILTIQGESIPDGKGAHQVSATEVDPPDDQNPDANVAVGQY